MMTKRRRVLVVDDEPMIQKLVVRALSQHGFNCDTADDGNDAEELMSSEHYDVVVSDLKMPNKHGHALAIGLLAQRDRPLIVIYTGVAEPRLAKDLLARGVDDIVFKPLDVSVLAAKVQALVDRRFGTDDRQAGAAKISDAHVEALYWAWARG